MKLRVPVLCIISALCASAQSNQASISGVVSDAQGALVPSAKVTMTNTATGVQTRAATNDAGFYSIPSLPVSDYTLSVEHEGFRRYVREGIDAQHRPDARPGRENGIGCRHRDRERARGDAARGGAHL